MGSVPSPIDCYFVLRSLKTLALRIIEEQQNALAVAKWLKSNPHVKRVLHPGKLVSMLIIIFSPLKVLHSICS